MNKTDIEWADYTWNPVTGCLHDCPYCYARRIAHRFGLDFAPQLGDPGLHGCKYDSSEGMDTMLELDKPYRKDGKIQPYPMAFLPTYHRYRLKEPAAVKDGAAIFVTSMGDLFGEWVPDEWIREVFDTCLKAPQHRYLFLTKNPARYNRFYSFSDDRPEIMHFGASATCYNDMVAIRQTLAKSLSFLSLEPLLGDVDLGKFVHENPGRLKWVILGAQTGPGASKHQPRREWIDAIVTTCQRAGIPLFMKDSVKPIVGPEGMLRQLPAGISLTTKGGRANGKE